MSKSVERTGRARIWIVVMLVAGCAGSAAAVWWFAFARRPLSPGQASARWIMPQSRLLKTQVNATGIVRLKTGAEVRVGARISGIVRRLFVTVGSSVTQGEVIAQIDPRPIEARVQQARSQLSQAQVTLAKAARDQNRSRQLFDAGIISQQQFQDASATFDTAAASVQSAQSGVSEASVDLAYVDIRAPITGTVSSVSTQQGETVAASFATPTFVTIIQRDALEIVAMVDEADIGNVRPGEKATFVTETWPDLEFTGTLLRIAPVATILSGVVNYEVAISILHDIRKLKPDMTANVNITTAQRRVMVVPAACVHRDGEGSFVYVQSPSAKPLPRRVIAGNRTSAEVEILRGLDANTPVLDQPEGAVNR